MIAIIAVALAIVVGVVVFAVWHRLHQVKRVKKERWASICTLFLIIWGYFSCSYSNSFYSTRQLAEKVERVARKEAELSERGQREPVIYPDPSVPYEERCIM